MDEQEHIRAAQRGDARAFNQLVRAYQTILYRTAFRVMGDSAAAQDATQDACIAAFKNIRAFRGGSFKAWLLRIVTNACYDQLRAKKRKPAASLDAMYENADDPAFEPVAELTPHDVAEQKEFAQVIQRGLQTLAPDQRATFVLIDMEGLNYDEAAAATGANIGTVKSRLSRARGAMRDFLLAQEELLPAKYRLKSG
ncbi:MAG: sigma-70 family RNA polymerase sigma factor [Chloroflexi bacterium]|nr:sigma-70 family RNA polymerase sigma factor [Chloroflexota bacterium]